MAYPDVADRLKSTIADALLIIGMMFLLTYVFSFFDNVPREIRIASSVFLFVLYNPVLVSFFGGTPGHFAFGMRVKRSKNPSKNIHLGFAFLRFIAKGVLGWLSLITMAMDDEKRAIHDHLGRSVVIFADEKVLAPTS